MLYQILNGAVSVGGVEILSHINFEIKGNEKIAIVGRNGAGKTTLLKLIAGELFLERDDKRGTIGIAVSKKITIGMLQQQAFEQDERTVTVLMEESCPRKNTYEKERFEYEWEYDRLFTGFGFSKEDKNRKLNTFSGGQRTRIALIQLLLQKPDILLLDEPTNHLDIQAVEWLERYLLNYEKAVVMVSHDRFFLDRVTDIVYEVTEKQIIKYAGNYSNYRKEKQKKLHLQQKAYDRYKEEEKRLQELVDRFKNKAKKAAFARAKKKQMERLEHVEKPGKDDVTIFAGTIDPLVLGSKWVFDAKELKVGYESVLLTLTMRIKRGQKIGIIGDNGVGKTTFLKTMVGLVPKKAGTFTIGNQVTIGYFDQHAAQVDAKESVLEHFHQLFPSMTEKEVRNILGAYLFSGKEVAKRVCDLSGGEKSRLILAELLQSRPNFLVLDEPTNHMDVQAKETLESAFKAYTGTIVFISHDRYFVKQVAESILTLEDGSAYYYPFGYEHYIEKKSKENSKASIAAQVSAEDQALIDGIRAVPKAERHRLKEIDTEVAYQDWKVGLMIKQLEKVAKAYEMVELQQLEYFEQEELWLEKKRQAWEAWHTQCLIWYDFWDLEDS